MAGVERPYRAEGRGVSKRKQWNGRIYLGRDQQGRQRFHWVGRFDTRRERDAAVARAKVELENRLTGETMTCREWADRFLARYRREHKASSYGTIQQSLSRFLDEFGDRPVGSVSRIEAMDWAQATPRSVIPAAVTLFNAAVDAELIDRSPFRGLGKRTRGRSDLAPPTDAELDKLLDSCSVLGWYADQMRSLIRFAAHTGMRPGEMFALEWADIDFDGMRVRVERRVYGGSVDTPKSNRIRTIALMPKARDALLGLPTRQDGDLVFRSKMGKRMSQGTLSGYWKLVTARAGLSFDFYQLRHYCCHTMFAVHRLEPRTIAAQMGWSLASVLSLLAVYGHGDVNALEQIDRAFAENVVDIRDAGVTQARRNSAS